MFPCISAGTWHYGAQWHCLLTSQMRTELVRFQGSFLLYLVVCKNLYLVGSMMLVLRFSVGKKTKLRTIHLLLFSGRWEKEENQPIRLSIKTGYSCVLESTSQVEEGALDCARSRQAPCRVDFLPWTREIQNSSVL